MAKGTIHIGTSGWHYHHWKKVFYPDSLKSSERLSFYAQSFSTVELNNPFYRIPAASMFDTWKKTAPAGFLFAVKVNRWITHMKKLSGVATATKDFVLRAERLSNKLGPLLFQLPPSWKLNAQRLDEFTAALPRGHRYVFDFRNPTWYNDAVYDILHRHNCAFCIYELAGHQSPIVITADFVYLRLHGPGDKYQGSYSESKLADWAKNCKKWQREGKDVFCYFDNDQRAYAVSDAGQLKALMD